MSEDSQILEKATDQLCIDEVEIKKEEYELSDQVDVDSSSKNDESSGIITGTKEVLPLLEQSTHNSNTLDSATVNEND